MSYVVYCHLRADTDLPVYYGAGWRSRPFDLYNRSEAHIEMVVSVGIKVKVLHSGLTKEEAHALERKLISEAFQRGETLFNFPPEKRAEISRTAGKKTFIDKVGVHGRTVEKMTKDGTLGAETLISAGKGFSLLSKEQLSENGKAGGSVGGVKGGKTTGKQRWKCNGCDMSTTLGALGKHQKSSKHIGKTRVI